MTIKVKYEGLDLELDSLEDVIKLAEAAKKKQDAPRPLLTMPKIHPDQPRPQPFVEVKLPQTPRNGTIQPVELWKRLHKSDRNALNILCVLQENPPTVGMSGGHLSRVAGLKGGRGIGSVMRHMQNLCRKWRFNEGDVLLYQDRQWYQGPKIIDAIQTFSGLTMTEIEDARTHPESKV